MTTYREAVRKRLSKATPGPWHLAPDGLGNKTKTPVVYATGDDLNYVASFADYLTFHGPTKNSENSEFIAHARTDVEVLLGLVEKMEQALKDVDSTHAFQVVHDAIAEGRAILDAPEKRLGETS